MEESFKHIGGHAVSSHHEVKTTAYPDTYNALFYQVQQHEESLATVFQWVPGVVGKTQGEVFDLQQRMDKIEPLVVGRSEAIKAPANPFVPSPIVNPLPYDDSDLRSKIEDAKANTVAVGLAHQGLKEKVEKMGKDFDARLSILKGDHLSLCHIVASPEPLPSRRNLWLSIFILAVSQVTTAFFAFHH